MSVRTTVRALARRAGHRSALSSLALAFLGAAIGITGAVLSNTATAAASFGLAVAVFAHLLVTLAHGNPRQCDTCKGLGAAPLGGILIAVLRWMTRPMRRPADAPASGLLGSTLSLVRAACVLVPAGAALVATTHLWFAWAGVVLASPTQVVTGVVVGLSLATVAALDHSGRSGELP